MAITKQSVVLGVDSIAPTTKVLYPVDIVQLSNGIFNYLNVTRGYSDSLPQQIPIGNWSNSTIMDCDFDTLNAGNVDFLIENIKKILVKRKRIDAPYIENTWTTLFEIPINGDSSNFNFTVNDFLNIHNATYVYQLVPVGIVVVDGVVIEVEGEGQDSAPVNSLFDGAFICDADSFVKLIAGVEYGTMQTTQLTGIHQTLGGKYPIIVANSNVKYHSGSISGTILNENYGKKIYEKDASGNDVWTGKYYGMNRTDIIEARKKVDNLLTNKKPKIIKDDNGNAWLVIITDDINYSFFNDWGRGLGNISANWTEIGDINSADDIKRINILGR